MSEERAMAIRTLELQLAALKREAAAEELLKEVWAELGPYSQELSIGLRYKLQDFFQFDDSE